MFQRVKLDEKNIVYTHFTRTTLVKFTLTKLKFSISHATRGKLLWLIFFWFQAFINWNQTTIKPTSKNYLLPVHGWLKFFIPVPPKEQKNTEFRQFLERVLIVNVYSTLYWFLSRLSGLLQKKILSRGYPKIKFSQNLGNFTDILQEFC